MNSLSLSRRQLFKRSLLATALATVPSPLWAATRSELVIPPLIESRRGKPVYLGLNATQRKLIDNKLTEVWGMNGEYLGATVRVRKGDFVKLNYRNNLTQRVAMHIQGLQSSAETLGGVAHILQPNQGWSPIVPIEQSAGFCYYQACTLGNSAYQNYRGLVGLWLVEDDESLKAKIPHNYGVNDIPLILQDHQFNAEGQQLFQQNEQHFYGNRLLTNGQEAPYLTVARSWIRLRIVNASLSRPYDIQTDEQRDLWIISEDQGYLAEPKVVKNYPLAPGERVDLMLDLNEGGNVSLLASSPRGFFDKAKLFFNSDGELADNVILELRPEGLASVFTGKPNVTVSSHIDENFPNKVSQERAFHLDSGRSTINEKRFDPRRIDVNARHHAVERWTITSSLPQGFRIQGAKFLVESINGNAVPTSQQCWKDTVWVEKEVKILITFPNISSAQQPFILGSSDLIQADKGCIGIMVVQ